MVPHSRIRPLNTASVQPSGAYVVYWMVAFRRRYHNFALQRAIEWAQRLGKPLVVLEPLRVGYRWASDRHHAFVIEGMAANQLHFSDAPALYYPYIEPEAGHGRGLVQSLASQAAVVVTDDYPAFFLPKMQAAVAPRLPVLLESVDSNGLFPMRATDRVFGRAVDFRRHLQRTLAPHLRQLPAPDPFAGAELPPPLALPPAISARWPAATPHEALRSRLWAQLPIDHTVAPVQRCPGGASEGQKVLRRFVGQRLSRYDTDRNEPARDGTSGLSPWLHFGHISVHEVWQALVEQEAWQPSRLGTVANAKREGFWGMSPQAEGFLDELITWREIGFNLCAHAEDYDQWESLPEWARATLEHHASDPREYVYTPEEFERGLTHDPLWNAAQAQLRQEGRIHNYLRMLWGKKILHWTCDPRSALHTLIELNNKYALDGRDPNSYTGIFWTLGRYDRPWGPERPIFGTIRYMTSDSTRRKFDVDPYIQRYSDISPRLPGL